MEQEVEGWYGHGGIELANPTISTRIEDYKDYRKDEIITLIQWHKSKETGEPYTSQIVFTGKDLYSLYEIIQTLPIGGIPYKPKAMWRKIIEKNNIMVEDYDDSGNQIKRKILINEFNGGSNRKIYFRYYYGPMRLLESWHLVGFSRIGIIRIE